MLFIAHNQSAIFAILQYPSSRLQNHRRLADWVTSLVVHLPERAETGGPNNRYHQTVRAVHSCKSWFQQGLIKSIVMLKLRIRNHLNNIRMCTGHKKVNSVTKTASFLVPRVDDCIDNIVHVKYATSFDFLKRFWQILLTDRAKEISAFITSDGLYQYKIIPFGIKKTRQQLINI